LKDKFFVSSPYIDLKNERLTAKMAITELNGEPILFEVNIEAQDSNSLDVCLSEVQNSDCLIVILGHKYGYEYQNKSISEREFDCAKQADIPILAFKLAGNPIEPKQSEFITRLGNIEDGTFFNEFRDIEELSIKIKSSIIKWRTNREQASKEFEKGFLSIVPLNLYKNSIFITNYKTVDKIGPKSIYSYLGSNDAEYYRINSDFILFSGQIWSLRDPKEIFKNHPEFWNFENTEENELFDLLSKYRNPIVALLNKSLRSWLLQNRWLFYFKKGIFYPNKGEEEAVKRTWKKQFKTSQKSLVTTMRSKEGNFICTRYLAFRANVEIFQNQFFVSIRPTYFFTNMYGFKSKYGSSYLSGIKRIEKNDAVSTNVAFMIDTIRNSFDHFNENNKINYLELGEQINIELPK